VGTGRSLNGRSGCLSCGRKLGALDLVPVLSWLALRGRCRGCEAKISVQYPLVELAGALAFLLAYRAHPFLAGGVFETNGALAFAFAASALSALVAIVAYDLRHKIIPDVFSAWLAASALARIGVLGLAYDVPPAAWGYALVSGPLVALPLYLLWAVSRGRWMGLGDPKLAVGLGWLLGFSGGVLGLFVAFLVGAAAGVALIAWSRITGRGHVTRRTELPFAPFLALGAAVAFATGAGVPELLETAAWATGWLVDPIVAALL
jgi:leader peptidase (prepilin peptidase)/N-methyltransferase